MKMLWPMAVVFASLICGQAQQRGLFPAILNLASNAEISTNATCGEPLPEMYCKLVEHVPGRRIRNPQCRLCDANSQNPKDQHPITNAIDGTNQWWQSPSIKNGRQFHWVTITLDLRQVFQVAYIIIKAANSPRPGNWVLERSLDGLDFQPWQYYAISDTECLTRYNVTPRLGPPTYKRDDEVICTSYYSRLVPLEHGEIHTSLINGRPSADDLTPELLDFTSARFIRLRLQRIRTLNADLMTLSYHDPREVDPIVTRRYYYSIKDVSVGGMCICYGHAQSCPWDPVTKKLKCVCEHNTCGESCNECCPGYHQEPWQPGTLSKGNTCEKCNCHNKADDCFYNQTVADLRLSLNTQGRFVGGGVCVNCSQNTAGVNCQTCADGYYRPHQVSPYADSPCVECECDARGSASPVCIRDDDHANLDTGLSAGQCVCKEGFAGEKCDRCAFGFRDFPQCTRCECNLDGSHNSDPCRECVCKDNVMGSNCDLCKQGFYNLQASNPEGCTECFCFGVSDVCESSTWFTSSVVHRDAVLLRSPQSSSIFTSQISDENLIVSNGSVSAGVPSLWSWAAPEPFLNNKLTSYGGFLNYSVAYDTSEENVDKTLSSDFSVIIEGNGRTLRHTPSSRLLLNAHTEQLVSVPILPRAFTDAHSGRSVQRDELMTLLADLAALRVRAQLEASAEGTLRLSGVSLGVADTHSGPAKLPLDVEQCECPWGYSGSSCEYCIPGFYRVGGILFGGNCLQCECNDHASECDINGECLDCTHNTSGPHCDLCEPGFYGDASEGTPDDCQRCSCPLTLESNNFSPTCALQRPGEVVCDQCPLGYAGHKCERCADGYYGDPTVPGQRCSVCECNGNVDLSEAGHCDGLTGECVKCVSHTAGRHCERCQDGFYGDAVTHKNCQACGCYGNGSLSAVCNVITGQCECKANVVGQTCDRCQAGYHGINSGDGCRLCECNQSGSVSGSCDEEGRCQCITGVTGDKCDRCQRGYYNFRENGCTPCDCAHTHGNCNAETGECICPPHTHGLKCEECEEGHWGHDGVSGCKACDCSPVGSSSSQCDLLSAQCRCNTHFSGLKCDRCALGFRNFPECTACDCDPAGTREEFCDGSLGVCGCEDHGQCSCKENVGGSGCDECKSGTFGLTAENPSGCSPCFCFGVSSVCEELSGLIRVPLVLGSAPPLLRVVSQSDQQGTLEGVYYSQQEMLLDAAHLHSLSVLTGPYYWRLPPKYHGNKLLSYGGSLSFTIAFFALDGVGLANHEPQVLMRGGHLRKLVIYTDAPAPQNGVRTEQEVPLTEHKWKYFNSVSDEAVSHADFMSVLSNVEYVLIKASYGSGLQQSRISNISLEVSLDADDVPEGGAGGVARLVEACECPPGYAGLSCQECSPGYYRQAVSELNMKGRDRPLIRPCVPCRCNNHSVSCDLETGQCLGCQHNTAGEHCHLCAAGHYGKVQGSVSDCSLCACPLRGQSFSATCVLEGAGDFRCDRCEEGYEGRYCERCSVGYHGDPSEPGGRCQVCRCNGTGSVHGVCDGHTGRCECKPGVRGHLCDQCEERHVLVSEQCVSCDDGCTGLLLDDLDSLDGSVASLNLSGVIIAPYSQLMTLENQTREVKSLMSWDQSPDHHLTAGERSLRHLSDDITDLQQQVQSVFDGSEAALLNSEEKLSLGKQLLELIRNTHSAITGLTEQVRSVNVTMDADLDGVNDTFLMEEMNTTLERIRTVSLTHCSATAQRQLSSAVSVLRRVQEEIAHPLVQNQFRLENISSTLGRFERQILQIQEIINTSESHNNQSRRLVEQIQTSLSQLTISSNNVNNLNQEVETQVQEAQDLLSDALNIAENMDNGTDTLDEMKNHLEGWSVNLRKHVDTLVMDLTKRDALQMVYRAEDHAQALSKQAQALNSSLSKVRSASVNATSVSQTNSNIRENIQMAGDLAHTANHSASSALNLTSEHSLTAQGTRALQASGEIRDASGALDTLTAGLVFNVTEVTSRLSRVRANVQNFTHLLPEALSVLRNLPNGSRDELLEARRRAEAVNATLQRALQRLEDYRVKLDESFSAVESVNSSSRLIRDSEEAASAASSRLTEAHLKAERLFERLKPLQTLGETLSRNLSDIRELINQARKQAASIKVAVSAERECVRAYRPEVTSSNFNTLTLTVKTSEPDNLLFYMGGGAGEDFMALEMRNGKVSFLWDTGSGHTRLEYPGVQINNDKWHRINATRFGRHGTLSVQQTDSDPLPAVKISASGSSTVMDVSGSTRVFVGGLGAQVKKPPAVRATQFRGCMGEAALNENNIGLWNYAERQGECGGCFMSPRTEDTSFHFDGSGFSVVQKSLRSMSTSVVMFFRTLSPNGLMLYLASNGTRDFLSVELVEGKVHLTFELGSGALTMTSNRTYNTGSWYRIALQRNKRKGHLSVMAADNPSEREVMEAESPGLASDLNRSDLDPIYIGGLPASRPIRRQVVARSFVGCMKNVEIARTNFDLLREAYGVKKGCVLKPIRSVSVFGSGFLEMPGVLLGSHTEIMSSFSSTRDHGILLAGFSRTAGRSRRQTPQPFLIVMLASGLVEVHVGVAEGGAVHKAVVQSQNGSFSDGQEHSLVLQRNKRSISVLVDEQNPVVLKLGSSAEKALALGRLFFGGVPPGERAIAPGSSDSFYGCIRNTAVDGTLLDLSGALHYEHVDMDSCLLEERPKRVLLPDDLEAEPTSDPSTRPLTPAAELSALTPGSTSCAAPDQTHTIPESHQFGLSRHSHMIMGFKNKTVRTSFVVKLSVRTFAHSGLLFYMANANQQDYAVLQLQAGRLLLSCDLGRGPASATIPAGISDGLWHTVKAEFSKKSVMVSVDGTDSDRISTKGHTLDVEGKLYLGGIPSTYTAKRIGNVTHSLAACLQDVTLNGVRMDLNGPLVADGTSSCFRGAQDGTFFSGSGYAAFMKEGYNVGSDVTVSLDFRSTAPDGILLGISSTKVDAIGLELINGQVVFSVNNGAGRISASSRSSGSMCDGRWRTLVANKQKHSLSLTVDGVTVTVENPYSSSTSAETKNPIYVGGHPAEVKQNCLRTRESFRGCMKNLRVFKGHVTDVLDFSAAFTHTHVFPHSCPA
ncbi:laminin subunit alpha-1 [Rhinichthys klamathensis goyatoka]|uniref:laminin subunit alpha-1 n=1 Tax=Rhinichthys klamathensis goyatoka TaxID=3034132 RepID=UPI0024B55A6A|nr:laminin subunit alpha-1 [Rhinichthys klamathensis goyatoka]